MGCALPLTLQYIITGGGFQNKVLTLFGLSGLMFIGIGDTCASVFGKMYGKSKIKTNSNKTVEGFGYFVSSAFISFMLVANIIYPSYLNLFMGPMLSIMFGALAETLTHQYDNLVCTILFYALLLGSHNYILDFV